MRKIKGESRRGRPKFRPTDEQRQTVEAMAGYGIPQEDIARIVINPGTRKPIDKKTLELHFRAELDTGAVKANAKVVQSLYGQAIAGNVTAAIWWTKARMGWHEKTELEHTGSVIEYEWSVAIGRKQPDGEEEIKKITARAHKAVAIPEARAGDI